MFNLIRRIFAVILFLVVGIYIIAIAPDYDYKLAYGESDVRVILNDQEITLNTNKLPEIAIIKDNSIYLSTNTIDILFDKNLYSQEDESTYITASEDRIAYINYKNNTVSYDGDEYKSLTSNVIITDYDYSKDTRYVNSDKNKEIIYLPMADLEEVYGINIQSEDNKIIITDCNIITDYSEFFVKDGKEIKLKVNKDLNSKTIEILKPLDKFEVFNFDKDIESQLVRSFDGELGYVSTSLLISEYGMEEKQVNDSISMIPINIAWDYFGKNASSMSNVQSRSKVDSLDVVCPTFVYLLDSSGNVSFNDSMIKEYTSWANQNDYDVWLTVKNDEIILNGDEQRIDKTSEFLNGMKNRQNLIKKVIEMAIKYEVQGINIDFEHIYEADGYAFVEFIRELSVECSNYDLVCSVCVNVPDGNPDWSLCYKHKELAEYADYLCLMSYDEYGSSSTQSGPNASYEWVEENIQKLVERDGVDANKILLGIAFYSRLWNITDGVAKSTTLTMNGAKQYLSNSETIWDENAKQYYYLKNNSTTSHVKYTELWIEDSKSIAEKLQLIDKYNLAGSAIWRLGFETDDVWEAFQK